LKLLHETTNAECDLVINTNLSLSFVSYDVSVDMSACC